MNKTGKPLILPTQNFRQNCLNILENKNTRPLILVWQDNNGIGVSVHQKVKNAAEVAKMLFTMFNSGDKIITDTKV